MSVSPVSSLSQPMAALRVSPLPSEKGTLEAEVVPKRTFEFELLCNAISAQLLDGVDEIDAAMNLVTLDPDILKQFSDCAPSVVTKAFKEYLRESEYAKKKRIRNTIRQLSIQSVLNSKWKVTIEGLEQNISPYLTMSANGELQGLIEEAKKLLVSPIGIDLEQIKLFSYKLNQMQENLELRLKLFFYSSDVSKEFIEILAKEVTDYSGNPRYPNCKAHFQTLCQNLNTLAFEKRELIDLLGQIRQTQMIVLHQMGPLYVAQEQKEMKVPPQKMLPEREKFFNANTDLFWEKGEQLLTEVFVATLRNKKVSPEFSSAVTQSADSNPKWNHLRFERIFPQKGGSIPSTFDVGYVGNVWGVYTATIPYLTDLGDFMRLFINALPKQIFLKLKTSPDKEKTLHEVFFEVFGKKVTFLSLKNWVEKEKPLA